jgi:uncharacterized protein (DUF885 family)
MGWLLAELERDGMVSVMLSNCRIVLASFLLAATASSIAAAMPATEEFPCSPSAKEPLLDQANRFILAGLRLSPVEATQAGYHGDAQTPLDTELDSYSTAAVAAQRALLVAGKQCFAAAKAGSPEDAADLSLLKDNVDSSLFQLDQMQSYKYRPQDYVEMIGSGLFFPLTATTGTELERLTAVVARMEQIPRVMDEARQNLKEADPVYIDTALDENSGDIAVIAQVGGMIAAASPLRPRYDAASKTALAALNGYASWLKEDLAKRPHTVTWRTGPAAYAKIFAYALGPGTHETPDSVLASAERDLAQVRAEMYTVALPLHRQSFPEHGGHGDLSGDALQNKVIAEVIDRINQDHVEPGLLLEKVKEQAKGIRAFIVQKDLMTLSDRDNMRIVPTPEFLRGVYSVAGFHSAPALDPAGEAEYWVTPIDPKVSHEQAESKLREYNNWMLQYLTMHEALPGHYTQFEHANNLQPASRRILRGLLGSGPYEEGWGEYAVREMEDAGYAGHDPRFVLMVQKIRLRVITNAILDIRMQSRNMTDDEAMNLMEQKAFQTHAEAEGKLRRAKLTAGQLIFYYVGYHQWIDMRDRMQAKLGSAFRLKQFNNAALDEGPLPIPLLEPLLAEKLTKSAGN